MMLPSTVEQVREAILDPEFLKAIQPYGVLLNTGLGGQPDGFTLPQRGFKPEAWDNRYLGLAPTSLYEFTAIPEHPLMYCDPNGTVWQTDRHFFTDKGSIPNIFRWKFSPDECCWFLFHDSAYMYHGLYRMDPADGTFSLQPWERSTADSRLHDGYLIQWPEGKYRADTIWAAVRVGGGIPWNADRGAQEAQWRSLCT